MTIRACLALVLLATACGREPPTQEEIDDAKTRVDLAIHAAHQARIALELLGILPVYTCDEPRRTFVGRAAEGVGVKVACVTATAVVRDESSDAVVFSFPETPCSVNGHTVSGHTDFIYNGGEDRMDLSADLNGLVVDGKVLQATVGYGTCGDEKRFWTAAAGALPGRPGNTYRVDGRVGLRDGAPLFGSTSLVFDGPGQVSGPLGTDRVTFTGLEYEVGEFLPKKGQALIETARGHRVRVDFSEVLWRVGKVEVEIDDKAPVTVPIVR
ncbi:hypothetical protein ATI61_103177 [Archangium gephyra]|uniref:Lipoprotein n=1 Tax=Archangium gephyra TaxID=48 RepID=A0AAC8TD17_9BACT|nr:hypothetical protein [Archangium gephyra]AKJ01470.1 putative lipoprotein [Archangium gephyra]REG34284.1 hypothetical protein ATI61_103177 [Archangium gephyra]